MKRTLHAAALAIAVMLTGCAWTPTTPDANAPGQAGNVRFPSADRAWLKGGSFVDVEQLRRMGLGMTKDQVRALIGDPHFSDGLFGTAEWNYLFDFRTGKGDEFVACQYKVVFSNGVSSATYWKDPACAAYLQPRVSEVVRPVASGQPERIKLGADTLFAFDGSGAADMLPEGRRQLDVLAGELKGRYKRVDSITIVGHTDPLGSDARNQALSVARAATVRDYLVGQGLPARAMRAFGVGSTQPLVTCDESLARPALIACLQPNRRVELELQGER